jgi:prepilin-type N-terminal cleavage/methylation domain-containing protein
MKTNTLRTLNRRGFTLVELLVVIVIIAALAGLTAPMVMNQRKKADLITATNNAKNIGLAMLDFETNYGSFPDSTTATQVTANTGSTLTLGTTNSNNYFRQLIAAEICQSEEMFYAKTAFSQKPDNVFNDSTKALAKGEVGFGYILNVAAGLTTSGNPARPIVVTPQVAAFTAGQFDTDIYDSKAVVLNIDNSVKQLQVLKTTKLAQLGGGKNLLQTGPDTIWGSTITPTIVNPDPK